MLYIPVTRMKGLHESIAWLDKLDEPCEVREDDTVTVNKEKTEAICELAALNKRREELKKKLLS